MLDTNSWIEYFKNRNGVAEHVDALPRTQLCASEITVAELIYGAYNSKNFEKHYREAMWLKNNIEIYPISDALDDYGDIRFATKRKGNPIGLVRNGLHRLLPFQQSADIQAVAPSAAGKE